MKIRTGFVSNSSSASFIIDTYFISGYQLMEIKKYIEDPKKNTDEWSLHENGSRLEGFTICDNEGFRKFLQEINVSDNAIEWEHN